MERKLDIIIADDHTLFRQSLHLLLKKLLDGVHIREACNGKELIKLVEKQKAGIILMDLEMPGMDGVEAARYLMNRQKYRNTKIIVLTMHDQERFILDLIEAGVYGYLLKESDADEIKKAILSVASGQYYVSQQIFDALRRDAKVRGRFSNTFAEETEPLTRREEEILMLVCREYTNREIADELNLSIRTVDGHRNRLLRKTGMKNTAGLVKFALKTGFYSLND